MSRLIDADELIVMEFGGIKFVPKEFIDDAPTIEPERQRGEWIDYTEDGYVECPFCHSATNCDGNKEELQFCFSCGADMRGERNE